ncbi:hypothetical protein AOLI_G00063200 [Acnodon oligacanthus]
MSGTTAGADERNEGANESPFGQPNGGSKGSSRQQRIATSASCTAPRPSCGSRASCTDSTTAGSNTSLPVGHARPSHVGIVVKLGMYNAGAPEDHRNGGIKFPYS